MCTVLGITYLISRLGKRKIKRRKRKIKRREKRKRKRKGRGKGAKTMIPQAIQRSDRRQKRSLSRLSRHQQAL